jgi:hypothetical protein
MRPWEPLINPGIDQRLFNLGVLMKFSIGLLIACITITSAYAATNDNLVYNSIPPIPVPAAVWLIGSALAGFIGYSRRKIPGQPAG